MITAGVSRRYAKAIFELALDTGAEETIGRELQSFSDLVAGSPLGSVLNNPAYPLATRKNILTQVTHGLQSSPLLVRFVSLLLAHRRLDALTDIARQYKTLLNQAKGRIEARVVGATPLDRQTLERVRDKLRQMSGKEVLLQSETDPGLIAGLVIELEGKTYDGSARAYLDALAEKIEHGN